VTAALEHTTGRLPTRTAPAVESTWDAAPGTRDATWDLAAHHYCEWYPVPDQDGADRISAALLSRMLSIRLSQHPALSGRGLHVMASDDLVTPEGRFLLLSGGGRNAEDIDLIRKAIADVVAQPSALPVGVPSLEMLLEQVESQVARQPNFAVLRKAMAGRPGAEYLEAQVVLSQTMFRHTTGLRDDGAFEEALDAADASRVKNLAEEIFAPTRRGALVLRPE